jgi:hypothetical protein
MPRMNNERLRLTARHPPAIEAASEPIDDNRRMR